MPPKPVQIYPVTWLLLVIFLLSYIQSLNNTADSIVGEISKLYLSSQNKNTGRRNTSYSKQVMIFGLTVAGYSAKSYRYLRNVFNNCLPSPQTLKKYRNRVDGSPGFSTIALKMVTNKVLEMSSTFRSLGCKLSHNYQILDTATDILNNLGENVLALFDAPHLSKLGIILNQFKNCPK